MTLIFRRALLFLFLAGSASAGQLVAGPEVLLGDAALGMWAPSASAPVLAGDGDETLVILPGQGVDVPLFAVRLDRDGRPIGSVLPLVPQTSPIRISSMKVRGVFLDGVYVVFYLDGVSLRALRVSREGTLLDDRLIVDKIGWGGTLELAVGDGELALFGATHVVRLQRDLRPIAVKELAFPPRSVAAGAGGYVLGYAASPALGVRLFDGKAFRELIRLGGNGNGGIEVAWSGSEYVVAWSDCHDTKCPLILTRFDAAMQRVGEPVTVSASGGPQTLTAVGDGVVALTWGETGGAFLQRFRAGVAIDPQPIRLAGAPSAAAMNGHGLLILADDKGRVSAVPAFGASAAPFVEAFRSAAHEQFVAAGGSASEVGVIVRRLRGAEGAPIERLFRHDGRLIRESVLEDDAWTRYAFASDGTELAVLGISCCSYYTNAKFRNLTTGRGSSFRSTTSMAMLAYADGAYHVPWYGTRVYRLSPAGEIQPVCEKKDPDMGGDVLVAGGGELLFLSAFKSLNVLRVVNGCPGDEVLRTPLPFDVLVRPAAAWNGERWGALLLDSNGGLHFATAPAGGAFTLVRSDVLQGQARSISLAPVAGGWIAMAVIGTKVQAALLDSSGVVASTLTVADIRDENTGYYATELVPVAGGGGAMAFYTAVVHEPPYFGVQRVLARSIQVEPSSPKRRSARH